MNSVVGVVAGGPCFMTSAVGAVASAGCAYAACQAFGGYSKVGCGYGF